MNDSPPRERGGSDQRPVPGVTKPRCQRSGSLGSSVSGTQRANVKAALAATLLSEAQKDVPGHLPEVFTVIPLLVVGFLGYLVARFLWRANHR